MSRNVVAAAGVAGGLVLGILIGFLFFGEDGVREGMPSGSSLRDSVGLPPDPGLAPSPAADPRSAPTPIETRSYDESTSWIIDSVATPEREVGDGVITGTVTTEDGTPLAGVVVRATREGRRRLSTRSRRGDPAPRDPDLRTRVLEVIQSEERARVDRSEATSDEQGAFQLCGLTEDPYSLEAWLEGYELKPAHGRPTRRIRAGQTVEFTAVPVITVPVDVRLPDGTQPTEASLTWKADRRSRAATWSRDEAELRLTPGAYAVHAESEDDRYRSDPHDLLLTAGEPPPTLRLDLHARTGLRGRVRLPAGATANNLQIRALRFTGGTPPDKHRLQSEGEHGWTSSRQDFRFKFLDLQPGSYLLGAGRDEIEHTLTVQVPEGVLVEQDIVLPESDPNAGLIVWVEGPDGQLLKNGEVRFGHRRSFNSRQGAVRRQRDGSFLVTLKAPRRDLPAMLQERAVLTVSSPRHGEKIVPCPAKDVRELRVRLDEPSSLEVTLAGYVGSGLEGRLGLQLVDASMDAMNTRYFGPMEGRKIGSDGRQTFTPIQSGSYVVQLMWSAGQFGRQSLITAESVVVGPGPNTLAMTVPKLHSLTVIFGSDYAGRHASLEPRNPDRSSFWGSSQRIGASGEVLFTGLKAGSYVLVIHSPLGQESMPLTVPSAGQIRFTPAPVTALRLTTDDKDGTLAALGLRQGDLITGAGDTDFDGSRPADQILKGLALAQERLTLRILRDGKPLQLSIDTASFRQITSRGSNVLQPEFR